MNQRKHWSLEVITGIVLFLAVGLLAATFQKQVSFNEGKGWDGVYYAKMTEDINNGVRPNTVKPFVYRIGGPFLASLMPGDTVLAWKYLGILANCLSYMLFWSWLRAHITRPWLRLLLLAMFVLPFHSMARRVWYTPINPDYLDKAFLLLGLVLIVRVQQTGLSLRNVALLSAVVFFGVLIREIVIIVACALVFLGNPLQIDRERLQIQRVCIPSFASFVPLVFGVSAIVITRVLAHPVQEGQFFLSTAVGWFYEKPFPDYLYAWFVAFGPVLVLPIYDWRNTVRFLLQNQWLLVYFIAFAVLAWIGGSGTFRLLHWATPAVMLLIGMSIDRNLRVISKNWIFLALLISSYVVSQRVFWLFPDYPGGTSSYLMVLTPLTANPPVLDIVGTGSLRPRIIGFASYMILSALLLLAIHFPTLQLAGGAIAKQKDQATGHSHVHLMKTVKRAL